ncbi:phosphate ABC transporter permease PstA [Abyssisolibacter fermentans]|uniref:phosphate ABC transporter permease PstA n=1 Tax=Abyssisolibacter fermentans TaxID=1766203 RepID=UPI000830D5DF|nr:phosphate ABC transporter permease PstA [Abyssisolibacter fermentans]
MKALIWLSAAVTVGILIWIIGYVVINGITEINIKELLSQILITLYIIFLTIIVSAPIGILSAIYLVEYAKKGKFVRLIRFATECLASIPSIIFGLFGMILFVVILGFGWSILAGTVTLSIMVLPTIIRTTEEALKSVPDSYREGSLGLGASKLRTVMLVILPSAMPGILTAVILSIGRIIGETAAVYLTAGTVARIPSSIMDSGRTLSVHLYLLAKEGISFEKAYATATILIIIVLFINLVTNKIAKRLNKSKMEV